MSFLNPAFLIALVGGGLPILIHLLTRDRIRRVAFSTLRFFIKNSRAVLRRRRVREMILLAMRVLACILLALAFARPIFGTGRTGTTEEGTISAERATVVVLDRSGSMAATGAGEAGEEKALTVVGRMVRGADAAGLVTFAGKPRVAVPVTDQLGDVEAGIIAADPGSGASNISEALRQANEMLRLVDAGHKEVVLVSDLQRSGWRGFAGDWRLAPGTKLTVEPVKAEGDAGNVAIVDADYPMSMVRDATPRTVAARVANYSEEDLDGVEVSLVVRGEKTQTQRINIPAGKTTPVRFRQVFDVAGDNHGRIDVAHEDVLGEDNTFHFNVRVIPQIDVLVLNGRPSRKAATDGAFFIRTALAPSVDSAFKVRTVDAAGAKPSDFERASVAVLANVLTVDAAVRGSIVGLLDRGGGLFLLPGDRVKADVFNSVFAVSSPCKLRRTITPTSGPGRSASAALTKIDMDHAVFQPFQLPHHGELGGVKFFTYWEVTDSQLARVLARFDDGRPALLEMQIGDGVSMLMASAVDLKWNDLPRRAVYLPMLHQIVRYLAIRTEVKTRFVVGEAIGAPEGGEVRGPDGGQVELDGAGRAVVRTAGLYEVMDGNGQLAFRAAVNRDFAEADPQRVSADEIVSAVVSSVEDAGEGGSDSLVRSRSDLYHVWWYLTAALAVLLVGELFLGAHTQRH